MKRMHPVGVEPTTFCLSNKRSTYWAMSAEVVGLEPTTLILKTKVLPIKLYLPGDFHSALFSFSFLSISMAFTA